MLAKYKQKAKELAGRITSKSPILSSMYYAFGSGGFHDEHFAIVSGIFKNYKEKENIGNFRRNIHLIEKGLITSPPKPVFAENYIFETVKTLKTLIQKPTDPPTLIWSLGILKQYFNTVKDTPTIVKAKKEFQQIQQPETRNLPETYIASNRITSNISYNDFFELNLRRRSVRYYQNKPVSRILVESAVTIALQAPSACNRQPFMFTIIDDPILIKEAAQLPNGATTFAENIKMMVFVIGDLSNYFDERDKHLIYIDGSLAVMNFILTLEILGLSSCIINWSDIPANNKKLKHFLKLENWEQCVMSISVGYADPEGGIPSSIKKKAQSIIKYNLS